MTSKLQNVTLFLPIRLNRNLRCYRPHVQMFQLPKERCYSCYRSSCARSSP